MTNKWIFGEKGTKRKWQNEYILKWSILLKILYSKCQSGRRRRRQMNLSCIMFMALKMGQNGSKLKTKQCGSSTKRTATTYLQMMLWDKNLEMVVKFWNSDRIPNVVNLLKQRYILKQRLNLTRLILINIFFKII